MFKLQQLKIKKKKRKTIVIRKNSFELEQQQSETKKNIVSQMIGLKKKGEAQSILGQHKFLVVN